MAQGYLVTLGDGVLDSGDAIGGPLVTIPNGDVETIGSGSWTWSGTWTGNGNSYSNISDTGTYFVDQSTGNVYFTPDNYFVDPIDSAESTTHPDYPPLVEGTAGDEVIDAAYDDADGDSVSEGDDTIVAEAGNDVVAAGGGDDVVLAGSGADSVEGGAGDDVIRGDGGVEGQATGGEYLDWSAAGASGADLSAGFVQDTGGMRVTVEIEDLGGLTSAFRSETAQFVDGGEPFDDTSSLQIGGAGNGGSGTSETVRLTMNFSENAGGALEDSVRDVQFRINDIDQNSWDDVVTITAIGPDGSAVPVTISFSGTQISQDGNTLEGSSSTGADSESGSALITIPGPVSGITVDYANAGSGGQALWLTDVHFDPIETDGSDFYNDSLSGGDGDDIVYGERGNDDISGGDGADDLYGGAGEDRLDGGAGNDTIDTGATDGAVDTVVLSDGDGEDVLIGFEVPVRNSDGSYSGRDRLDVSDLTDANGVPVNIWDAEVTEDSGGNAVMTFPNGESLTLMGVSAAAISAPAALIAMGIPSSDGTVSGTDGDDLIFPGSDTDPDGDRVDSNDAILPGDFGNDDLIEAGLGNDEVYAGGGHDEVYGGKGNDKIFGGTEDDTLFGEAGNDTLVGEEGADTLFGGAGDDRLAGGEGGDTLVGGAGDDILGGDGGADTLTGGDGNDKLDGGDGADTLFGGVGDDLIEGGSGDDTAFGADGNDSINGGIGDDHVYGGIGDDYVRGSFGNDTVYGGEGDDFVWGGYGDDVLVVENDFGNDTYVGEEEDEIIGDELDLSLVTDDLTIDLTALNPEAGTISDGTYTATFEDIEIVTLGGGTDTLILADGSGSDRVGGFEAPTPNGDGTFTGFDQLDVTGLNDDGGRPVDTDDVIVTADLSGNAVLSFPNGEVLTLIGVAASDVTDPAALQAMGIPAPPTSDGTVTGTTGDDTIDLAYTGDPDGDTVDADDAILPGDIGNDDLIVAGGGNDSVSAGDGDDEVFGGTGDDHLAGGTGSDILRGEAGNDRLDIAEGDSAFGGGGDDLFTLTDLGESTNGTIEVVGGESGEIDGDTLDLGTLADLSTLTFTNSDPGVGGGLTGSVMLDDGTRLNFTEIENIICFTPGTTLATPQGARPIETLAAGDLVVTRDNGLQPIRWIGRRTVPATGRFAPVWLKAGTLTGQCRDLTVSPQHRMLFRGFKAELLFGTSEVLVPALHLIDDCAVRQIEGGEVEYIHILFDQHEIVFAEGAATESFHPGEIGLDALEVAAREELFAIFPELRAMPQTYGAAARRSLKRHETRAIFG